MSVARVEEICDLSAPGAGGVLADALASRGYAVLTSHGVESTTMADMRAVCHEFFDLPRQLKARSEYTGIGLWRGWQPVHEGGAAYGGDAGPTELLERLEENLCASAGGPDNPGNRWPDQPRRLRSVWQAYHDAMFDLTTRLFDLLVSTLELDPRALPAWCEGQFSNLVANFYPAHLAPPEPGRVRVAPHTDHGGVTILCVDSAPGGLEVAYGAGGWCPVTVVEEALVVQAGDLLERWTGGRLHATPHRVVNPPLDAGPAGRRLSLVYFHHPDLDTVVAPSLADDRYPPVRAGDHVAARQDRYRRDGPA